MILSRASLRLVGVPIIAIVLAMLAGCQTSGNTLLALDPDSYEDEVVKLDYRIGSHVYYLRIENKTQHSIMIDSNRASIVSVRGETQNLRLTAEDNHIPPRASLVLTSGVPTFFHTDIDSPFENRRGIAEDWSRVPTDVHERELLVQFTGETIRLYLPLHFGDEQHIIDLDLQVRGVAD